MISLRARILIFLLEHRQWFRGQLRRPRIDERTSIAELREQLERSASRFGKLPSGLEVAAIDSGLVRGEWLRGPTSERNRGILYFHGGGYVMGSPAAHRRFVAKFVADTGTDAFTFTYRLAPENPFPGALNDAVAAYRWFLEQGIDSARAVFIGDSAGGGLLLATLLAARDHGLPLPGAAVAMSPWTDLACTGASYAEIDPLAPDGSWEVFGRYYTGSHDPREPLISPLYGDLTGLPPLLIYVGEEEVLLDDALSFAAKAERAGVDVTLRRGKGMAHCFPLLAPMFPEATAAMAEICSFVRKHSRASCPRCSER